MENEDFDECNPEININQTCFDIEIKATSRGK